jgi:hypothetical protein
MSFLPGFSSEPYIKVSALFGLAGLFVVAEVAVWLAFVPELLSTPTFAWLSVLACTTVIAAASTVVRGRSTRSIAHLLYDVEHPSDSRRV